MFGQTTYTGNLPAHPARPPPPPRLYWSSPVLQEVPGKLCVCLGAQGESGAAAVQNQRQPLVSLAPLAEPAASGPALKVAGSGLGTLIRKLEKEIIENEVAFLKCLLCTQHYFKHLACINLLILIMTVRG